MSLGQREPRSAAVPSSRVPAVAQRANAVPAPLAREHGEPLEPALRTEAESRFDSDFGAVRIHADASAAASARSIDAAAYTVGTDIVFGAGRFAPHSAAGSQLLAHELAHVVQQSQGGSSADAESRADAAAVQATQGRGVDRHALGGAPVGVQAKPEAAPPLLSPLIALDETLAGVELAAGDPIGKDSPKLMQLAASYKASAGLGGGARVRLAADLPSELVNDSAKASAERARLGGRMRAVRDALEALGVPADMIDLSPATAFARSAHGQVSADVRKRSAPGPSFTPGVPGVTPPVNAPGPVAPAGLPSFDLELKFGPVTISLPKEVRAKLPIALGSAKKLTIELGAEVPAKFSLKITLDGVPHVRVALKAGAEVDTKSGAVIGSAGLQIDTVASVCTSPDPGETLKKIKTAGDKLNKAALEYTTAADSDKLGKLFDIAGAIGEMYDAVDKAKAKCKPVPRASVEFGYKRLLSPGSEADPTKQPPLDYAGVTATFNF